MSNRHRNRRGGRIKRSSSIPGTRRSVSKVQPQTPADSPAAAPSSPAPEQT